MTHPVTPLPTSSPVAAMRFVSHHAQSDPRLAMPYDPDRELS